MKYFLLTIIFLLSACGGDKPDDITPIQTFDANRYLGTWYEIARLDHRFERGLSQVTAEYSLRDDGGIKVINRGYSEEDKEWNSAEGKAYFVSEPNVGHLKVSFWGPFYSAYVVMELDEINYQYALVAGGDKNYLWILSRTPQMEEATYTALVEKAKALGFATDTLIKVDHQPSTTP